MTTTTTVAAKARKRRRKTRTKNVNSLPPIVASELKANEIDLTPGKEHLVCPDCSTWVPITGMLGTPKLVPHHTGRAGAADPQRCTDGSNRRVTVDVEVDVWRAELAEAAPSVASRRATKVLPKPKTGSVPAATQLRPAPLSAESVRLVFARHRTACAVCEQEVTGRDRQPRLCPDGERLVVTYLRLLRQEPRRKAQRDFFARERRRFDRQYADPAQRTAQWAAVLPAVREADGRRVEVPAGPASAEARDVPTAPENSEAFDVRQAELGRRSVMRASNR
ncbi:hypothetical protein ABZ135_23615 [Streptomyces sp. NPDC006339]|uniref:hypothetical protein n=1 Tax=Streptomyces sp. NPDC006339 TaxID=3156755 RepID=UPI0033AD4922